MNDKQRTAVIFTGLCLLSLASLACEMTSQIANLQTLSGVAYFVAVTETAVPTVTVFLGTTTPVYPPTPVPAQITLPPEWTTVTTLPIIITETPVPPWTTTPSLHLIGYSTPVPVGTPYYRVGTFYLNQDIYLNYPNPVVIRLNSYQLLDSATNPADQNYLLLDVTVKNFSGRDTFIPVADIFFVREVATGEGPRRRTWSAANEPLAYHNLPSYQEQLEDATGHPWPIPHLEERAYTIGFILPKGEVVEVGLITDLGRAVNGGVPLWIRLEPDPTQILGVPCEPYVPGCIPPPPTPILLDENGTFTGGGGEASTAPPGIGLWPTNGTITRGYGCEEFYTGVDGAGFGCPPQRPWFHNGVDIANTDDNPIFAPIEGNILFAGFNPNAPDCADINGSQPPHQGLGNYQRIGDGQTLHYLGHLSGFVLTSGGVNAGDHVSRMGSTGCSTGSHLHWIVYDGGTLLDPQSWAGPGPPP